MHQGVTLEMIEACEAWKEVSCTIWVMSTERHKQHSSTLALTPVATGLLTNEWTLDGSCLNWLTLGHQGRSSSGIGDGTSDGGGRGVGLAKRYTSTFQRWGRRRKPKLDSPHKRVGSTGGVIVDADDVDEEAEDGTSKP
ncbi:hypothetical protein CF319_g1280 [Tilletia indica]|nr:hypothetical protein CF319_g1280 [Tilletia indica]